MITSDSLKLDAEPEIDRISATIREYLLKTKKRGLVVALSGGIDSSVVGALAVRALGKGRVFGLLLPERDSSEETRRLGALIVKQLGIGFAEEDITQQLEAVGCYRRRDEAIRKVIPDFGSDWKSKIVLPRLDGVSEYRLFSVVASAPDGREVRARLGVESYLGVVAATNFKQRCRKALEYYHADRLNFAVAGTPNLLEYDQGFFVKLGDGAADIKPIAHLYKTQVYQLAEHLGVPEEIRRRPPTTDTYSLPQTQEEFYFSLPYAQMDLCLYAKRRGLSETAAASALGLTPEQVGRVFRDIEAKQGVARYLHHEPQLVDPSIKPGEPLGTAASLGSPIKP
jgi:NAD+ synthase